MSSHCVRSTVVDSRGVTSPALRRHHLLRLHCPPSPRRARRPAWPFWHLSVAAAWPHASQTWSPPPRRDQPSPSPTRPPHPTLCARPQSHASAPAPWCGTHDTCGSPCAAAHARVVSARQRRRRRVASRCTRLLPVCGGGAPAARTGRRAHHVDHLLDLQAVFSLL